MFRSCTFVESFSAVSSCRLDTPFENPYLISKIVYAQSAMPFSTFGRTKRRKGKFGASEHVSTLAGFTFEGRLVRLGCFV